MYKYAKEHLLEKKKKVIGNPLFWIPEKVIIN